MLAPKRNVLKISFSSIPENIRQIEPFLNECSCNCPIQEERYKDILLVLTEAVNNGIRHGNSLNPQKNVTVEFHNDARAFHFKVSDEGSGFNPQGVADPTQGPNLAEPNGRGVFLMHALSDQVKYTNNGRSVNLKFRY